MLLLLKTILAHFLGDFWLQPNSWVENKKKKKLKSLSLYLHIGIHAALLFLLLGFQYWQGILTLLLSHFLIDVGKLYLQKAEDGRFYFFADQALHLLAIGIFVHYFEPTLFQFQWLNDKYILGIITGIVFLTKPTSILIKNLISKWTPTSDDQDSLENAGEYIGMMERLFVFGFTLVGQWSAVGFVLGAKSIFRFGNMRGQGDRKMTEYVLIGTLLSFGIAILTGLVFRWFV